MAAASVHATVIAVDNFESYTAGSQLESGPDNVAGTGLNGGTGWTTAYNIDNTVKSKVKVVSKTLTYSNGSISLDGGHNAVQVADATNATALISRAFTSQSSAPVYFSFLYRTNNPTTSEDFVQMGLSNSATAEPTDSIGTSNGSGTPSYFFARVPNSGTTTYSSIILEPSTTYLLIGKAYKASGSSSYNKVDLFVDPDSYTEGTPTLTASVGNNTGASFLANLVLRTARMDLGDLYWFDNFTVSNSFASAIPEPTSIGLLGVGAFGLLARRRRAR